MKVISITNIKGGTGKTSIAIGIAGELARNHKVLIIDNDPQSNVTNTLLDNTGVFSETMYNIYIDKNSSFLDCVYEYTKNLYIVPNTLESMDLEAELAHKGNRENILKNKLRDIKSEIDYIIIDNSPFVSLQLKNSLVVSDLIICPIDNSVSSIQGITMLRRVIDRLVDDGLMDNRKLAVIRNRFDRTTTLTKQFNETLEDTLKDELFKTIIYNSIKYVEALALKKTIHEHSPEHSKYFKNLCDEIIVRLG